MILRVFRVSHTLTPYLVLEFFLAMEEVLTKCKGYKHFTKIDISMQYYTFQLDEESSWVCVPLTPIGKF